MRIHLIARAAAWRIGPPWNAPLLFDPRPARHDRTIGPAAVRPERPGARPTLVILRPSRTAAEGVHDRRQTAAAAILGPRLQATAGARLKLAAGAWQDQDDAAVSSMPRSGFPRGCAAGTPPSRLPIGGDGMVGDRPGEARWWGPAPAYILKDPGYPQAHADSFTLTLSLSGGSARGAESLSATRRSRHQRTPRDRPCWAAPQELSRRPHPPRCGWA